jgi:hypothetical protein
MVPHNRGLPLGPWVVWTGRRRWPAQVWSIVMPLSALLVLWIAVSFKLISFGVNY